LALNNLIDYTLLAFRTGENFWSLVGNVCLKNIFYKRVAKVKENPLK
jgi:hypothetical protein